MKRILTASYDQVQEVGDLVDLLGVGFIEMPNGPLASTDCTE